MLFRSLRADEQDEWTGMDISESGERAYISTDVEGGASGHTAPSGAIPGPRHVPAHAGAK